MEQDLKVIAKPGPFPFINSELSYGGFPEWIFKNYPEAISQKANDQQTTVGPIPAEGSPSIVATYKSGISR